MIYNEYEVLMLARTNDEDAMSLLLDKYKELIKKLLLKKVRLFKSLKIDIDFVYTMCIEALDEAIYNYNEYSNATFETYVTKIINRKIYNTIKQTFTKKEQVNVNAVDISEIMINVEKANFLLDYTNEPLTNMLSNETSNNKFNSIFDCLSKFEKRVLLLMIKGYTESEIKSILNKSNKQIYNTIQRIRKKYKQNIKNLYC